jgi:two-component system, NarL family, sensor histidine kinase DevS
MLLTRQQLEERLVALHRASLELVKNVSLDTLLERIATVALEQVNARYAALGVMDESGKLTRFIHVGMTPDEVRQIPHPPVGRGLLGEVIKSDFPIRVSDIIKHPSSVGFPAMHPQMHSFLGVPIKAGDKSLGQIYLTEKIGAPEFTQDDEGIIEMLGTYAAVAIQNARLYDDLREHDLALTRRNEDLFLLNSIAEVLTASLDLDDILAKTLGLVMDYLHVEAGEIFLLQDDRKSLRLVLQRGEAAEAFWSRKLFDIGEGIVGLVAQNGESIISHDLVHDERFLQEAVAKAGFRQLACFPLTSAGRVVGVLSAATRSLAPLDEHEVQLLTAVCGWAGLAIENARLHNNARRLAVLEERERIGMDLHDGIIQSIYGVGLVLEHAKLLAVEDPRHAQSRIQQAIKELNETIRDIRSYILDLRPRQLGDENLMMGLKRLVTEYRANTLSEAALSGNPDDLNDLQQDHALALFHICQESLANVAKHAAARKVDIFIWKTDDRILMEIRDDGNGFDLEKMTMTLGHGLSNIHTRAHNVGGDVEITSTIGEGTSILAWVPRTGK